MEKLRRYLYVILGCILKGLVCGGSVGICVFIFKYLASRLVHISEKIYSLSNKSITIGIIVVLSATVLGIAAHLLSKRFPTSKGGGISRSKGICQGAISADAKKTILGTAFGSMIGFFSGMPIGTEGPSVLLGSCVGSFFKSKRNREGVEISGAASGFSVATGTFFTAISFAFEEMNAKITRRLALTLFSAVSIAYFINRLLCRLLGISHRLFDIPKISLAFCKELLLLPILCIAVAAFCILINHLSLACYISNKRVCFFDKIKLPLFFLIVAIVGVVSKDFIFSGHNIIEKLLYESNPLTLLGALLVIRTLFLLSLIKTEISGGMFVPLLALGAVFGGFCCSVLNLIGLSGELVPLFVLISICAFLGGNMRIPLTSCIFFLELSGSITHTLIAVPCIFAVYLLTRLYKGDSFYEVAFEGIIEN